VAGGLARPDLGVRIGPPDRARGLGAQWRLTSDTLTAPARVITSFRGASHSVAP
jgi:hypothetical protein